MEKQLSRLELLQQQFDSLKNSGAPAEELLSSYICLLQQKDFDEFEKGVKDKKYYLSNFFKNELICRCANGNKMTCEFKVNLQAVKALVGLAFLAEKGELRWNFKPLDRQTYLIKAKLYSEMMNNSSIRYYNSIFELNIPLNDETEVLPDEEQYDCSFSAQKTLRIGG